MAKIKIPCPGCGRFLQCEEKCRGRKVKCPHCKELIPVPPLTPASAPSSKRRGGKKKFIAIVCALILLGAITIGGLWLLRPTSLNWPDRRPIGVLFLASNYHSSATNPRGWFNDPKLDVTGTNGAEHFRKALMEYTDRSLDVLKRTGAQGVIVWDLEGEQYPHKTTFIGDPRLVDRLAPEMAAVADEFFERLRNAGLRVGITIRPQQLVFDGPEGARQTQVVNTKQILLGKIDYARNRWGTTLFYVDSNGGIRRPDEAWQLRSLAKERPDILLIPEHHYLPYWTFSAPYIALRNSDSIRTATWARKLFPDSFQVLDVSDADRDGAKVAATWRQGDILMFRAWFWGPDSQFVETYMHEQDGTRAQLH